MPERTSETSGLHKPQRELRHAFDLRQQLLENRAGGAETPASHRTHHDNADTLLVGISDTFLELAIEHVVLQGDGF